MLNVGFDVGFDAGLEQVLGLDLEAFDLIGACEKSLLVECTSLHVFLLEHLHLIFNLEGGGKHRDKLVVRTG